MKAIKLLTMLDGKIVLNKKAKASTTLDEVCEIAESEVYSGFADYARVTVDEEIYMELES